uniref:DUF4262 domain-containing protein n=1 Tax=Thaumasiovibrio occultus TaxID=1891184 RepID=UPI000B34E546|nr:DUF4262 domain-containing protein [Thaumasiovibrio occultus]
MTFTPTMEFARALPPDFTFPKAEDDYDQRVILQIQTQGWSPVLVASYQDQPQFAFSLGHFYSHQHPEIIIMGQLPDIAHQWLQQLAVKITQAASPMVPEMAFDDIAEGIKMKLIPVALAHYPTYFGFANWIYSKLNAPFPAFQLVWSDEAGRFPWQEDCDPAVKSVQPLLDVYC